MKYSKECLACFNMVHHERHDVYFRYNKKKEDKVIDQPMFIDSWFLTKNLTSSPAAKAAR